MTNVNVLVDWSVPFNDQRLQAFDEVVNYLYNNLEADIGHSSKNDRKFYSNVHPVVRDTAVKLLTN